MKRIFSHTVLIAITNVIIKVWFTMLYTLVLGGFAVTLYEVISDPSQLNNW